MLTILSVTIQGFCSIAESTHIQLNLPGVTLIKAPYGSGKSTIFSAITWCLYGKDLKGVSEVNTWEKVRPNGYAGTLVEVAYQRNSQVYKVVRCQNYKLPLEDGNKGGNRLILYEDAYPVDIKGKVKVQEKINTTIGLNHHLFISSIMFGQGMKRLIQESNTDKKKIFEEIFDLNFLNLAKGIAQDDKNNLLSIVNDIEHESRKLKEQVEQSKNTYFELRERERSWKATIHRQRRELREKRRELTVSLQSKQRGIKDLVANTLDSRISRTEARLKDIHRKLQDSKSLTKLDSEDLITHILKLLKLKKYTKAYNELKTLKKAFNSIQELTEEKDELTEKKYNLLDIKRKYKSINDTCNILADKICACDEDIKKLKDERMRVLSPKYKKLWKQYETQLRSIDEEYHNKLVELEDYDWIITDPLGNNGIKSYLFDSSLDMLNQVLNSYSDTLGFRISFEVDLDSARKEFVTLIERDDHIIEYDELSGGEKSLVNLAMALAMNEALTAARGINVAFLDEVFEGLSDDGIEQAVGLINHVFQNKSLFLITHHDSVPLHQSRVMQVTKQNGLSRIRITI